MVAKAIENPFAGCESGDPLIGVKLIEIEPGLLTGEQGDFKLQPAGDQRDGPRIASVEDAVFRFESFRFTHRGVVAQNDGLGSKQFLERLGDEINPLIHREGEGLDHQVLAVAIDDEAGEAVRFAPGEPTKFGID